MHDKAKKWKHPPSFLQYLSRVGMMIIISIIIFFCIYAVNQIKLSRYFPIKIVRIYGIQQLDRQEVQALLLPLVDRGFFAVDVESIRDRLLQLPWLATIFVRRDWPDRVEITLVEKQVVALWNGQDLLSSTGELFSPKPETYPRDLPQFIGEDGKQIIMLQYFNLMGRLFIPLHVKISHLELTPYSKWKLKLTNGIALQIGNKDSLTRLKHFVKVYPRIVGDRAKDVEYIDLRYANGVAVQWKNTYGKEAKQRFTSRH